jgi:hypothetical protein
MTKDSDQPEDNIVDIHINTLVAKSECQKKLAESPVELLNQIFPVIRDCSGIEEAELELWK